MGSHGRGSHGVRAMKRGLASRSDSGGGDQKCISASGGKFKRHAKYACWLDELAGSSVGATRVNPITPPNWPV